MSFYSTLRIIADEPERAALIALRPELSEMVVGSYSKDVVEDFMQAFASGEGTIKLAVPAVQELIEWIHDRNPSLRFAAEVLDEEDGEFGDWKSNFGQAATIDTPATVASPAAGPNRERLKLLIAAVFALAAIAFFVLRKLEFL